MENNLTQTIREASDIELTKRYKNNKEQINNYRKMFHDTDNKPTHLHDSSLAGYIQELIAIKAEIIDKRKELMKALTITNPIAFLDMEDITEDTPISYLNGYIPSEQREELSSNGIKTYKDLVPFYKNYKAKDDKAIELIKTLNLKPKDLNNIKLLLIDHGDLAA